MFILIMLLQVWSCFGAVQDVKIFDQANELYAQGTFDQALSEYKKVVQKSGAVWYNMGNAAFMLQDYTHALLYWLRAQKYGDAYIYKEAHARLHGLGAGIGMQEKNLSDEIMYYGILVLKKFPVLVWQILFILFWSLLCWCRMKKYRCSAVKTGILFLLLLLMAIPIMIGYCTEKERVVIIAETVDIYNGPNSAFYKVGTLQKNKIATLLDTKKQWYKIAHDAIIGWVERKSVAKI